MDIMSLLKPIGEKYLKNEFECCIFELEKLWESIPDPKHSNPNAYLIIAYICKIYMKMEKYDLAYIWGIKGTQFNHVRNNAGEAEFLLGEIAFKSGEMEFAKDMFLISKKRSGGRCFKGENPDYKNLLNDMDVKI